MQFENSELDARWLTGLTTAGKVIPAEAGIHLLGGFPGGAAARSKGRRTGRRAWERSSGLRDGHSYSGGVRQAGAGPRHRNRIGPRGRAGNAAAGARSTSAAATDQDGG